MREISIGLRKSGYEGSLLPWNVSRILHSLKDAKYLEMKMRSESEWLREFRVDERYLPTNTKLKQLTVPKEYIDTIPKSKLCKQARGVEE